MGLKFSPKIIWTHKNNFLKKSIFTFYSLHFFAIISFGSSTLNCYDKKIKWFLRAKFKLKIVLNINHKK